MHYFELSKVLDVIVQWEDNHPDITKVKYIIGMKEIYFMRALEQSDLA